MPADVVRGHRNLYGNQRNRSNHTPKGDRHRTRQTHGAVGERSRAPGHAQILYAKIAWRMYEGGEIAVRDAYDLGAARKHDPQELAQACAHASPWVLETISAIIEHLPKGWSDESDKPLIAPRYQWSESELQEQALAALRTSSRPRGSE